jgi:hypothetical protein
MGQTFVFHGITSCVAHFNFSFHYGTEQITFTQRIWTRKNECSTIHFGIRIKSSPTGELEGP